MQMRTASFCPAFFPPTPDSDKVNSIQKELTIWFDALNKRRFKYVISPLYAERIKKWIDSLGAVQKIALNDCLSHIFLTASMMPFKTTNTGTSCSCLHSNKAWSETLYILQSHEIYVVVVPAPVQHYCGAKAVVSPDQLDAFREFKWLNQFKDTDWYLIPVDGESTFRPPKTWDRAPFYTTWPEFNKHKGYLDEKNQLWVYDRKEPHWDVYSRYEQFYRRITPEGKQLAKKPVHIRKNKPKHRYSTKGAFT